MALFSTAVAAACAGPPRVETAFRGEKMGTTWTVKVVTAGLDGERRVALDEAIRGELERVDALMSHYRPDSEVSRFNASDGSAPFPVSPETLEVVRLAQEVARLSGGAFDVTIAPLVEAWGFGAAEARAAAPGDEEIRRLLARVGHEALGVDPVGGTLSKRWPQLTIDLSAVAKGYAVDRVAAALDSAGVGDYLVEVGGELRVLGRNASGEPWRVAIERPVTGEGALQRVIGLSAGAVATSGEYRNFRIVEGRRVSHTIDPRTGRPIQHALAAVTVRDPSCARADALATALNVLGPEEGRRLALERGIAALFLVGRPEGGFEERSTPGFDPAP